MINVRQQLVMSDFTRTCFIAFQDDARWMQQKLTMKQILGFKIELVLPLKTVEWLIVQ